MFSTLPWAVRQRRLLWLALAGPALLLLACWNPVAYPGPVLCVSRLLCALPCPLCGATRGVALSLRGEFLLATEQHPLAVPITLLAIALLVGWSLEYLTGRRLVPNCPTWVGLLTGIALLPCWIYLLLYRREDNFAESILGLLIRSWW
jgi:hypothetical protein